MKKLDLKSIASALASTHNITVDDAEKFLGVLFEVVVDGLRHDGQVKVKGLGTFKLIGVPEREMVDVNSGERITVEARSRISFSPDAVLRDIINKPFIFFDTVVLNEGVTFDDEQDADDTEDDDEPETDDNRQSDDDSNEEEPASEPELVAEETENDPGCTIEEPVEQSAEEIIIEEPSAESFAQPVAEPTDEAVTDSDKGPEAEPVDTSVEETGEKTIEEVVEEHKIEEPSDESHTELPGVEDKERQNSTPQAVNKALDNAKSIMDDIQSGNLDTDDDEEDEGNFFTRNMLTILIVIMLLVGIGAFLYGTSGINLGLFDDDEETEVYTDSTDVQPVVKETLAADTISRDSLKSDSVKLDVKTKTDTVKAETFKVSDKSNTESDVYDRKDVRVRTGAYRIVGVAKVVKVRSGQTLKSITKAYLGEGMECYVEVLNGVTSASPGDSLKIPKLEWRKKRR